MAYVGHSSDTLARLGATADVAGRNVVVDATSLITQVTWVGGIAKGEGLGMGISVAINNLDRTISGVIGDPDRTASTGAVRSENHIDVSEGVDVGASLDGDLWAFSVAGAFSAPGPPAPTPPQGTSAKALQILGANATTPPTGVAVAAAVSINLVDDTLQASIADAGTIVAGDVSVEAADDFFQLSVTGGGAFTVGMRPGSKSLAGALSINDLVVTTRAFVVDTAIEATGDIAVSASRGGELVVIAVGLAGATGPDSLTVAGSVSVNVVENTTEAYVEGGALSAGGDIAVAAAAPVTIVAVAGAVAVTVGGGDNMAFGISVLVNAVTNTVRARVEDASILAGGKVDVTASSDLDVIGVAIAGSGSVATGTGSSGTGVAGAGAVVVNVLTQTVEALIIGALAITVQAGNLTVEAVADGTAAADAGGVAIQIATGGGARSGVTIGAAVAVNHVTNVVDASIDVPAQTPVFTSGDLSVTARSNMLVQTLALGIAGAATSGSGGGATFGGAGSGAGNSVNNTVKASLVGGVVTTGGDLSVTAIDSNEIHGDAGAVALVLARGPPASIAIGIAVASNSVAGTIAATLEGSDLTVGGDLTVDASSSSSITTVTLAASGVIAAPGNGFGLGLSAAGAIAHNSVAVEIEASLSDTEALVTGDVDVSAADEATIVATVIALAVAFVQGDAGTADRRRHLRRRQLGRRHRQRGDHRFDRHCRRPGRRDRRAHRQCRRHLDRHRRRHHQRAGPRHRPGARRRGHREHPRQRRPRDDRHLDRAHPRHRHGVGYRQTPTSSPRRSPPPSPWRSARAAPAWPSASAVRSPSTRSPTPSRRRSSTRRSTSAAPSRSPPIRNRRSLQQPSPPR